MKLLLMLFLISLLQETVIGRTIVKRDCNDCCCTSNCTNCCSSSCSNCKNCCQSNSNCCQSNSNCCQSNSNCCQSNSNCCQSNSNCCQSNSNCCQSNSNCCQSNSNCNSNCNSCQNCQNNCKESCSCGVTEQVPVLVPFPPVQPAPTVNDTTLNIYNFTANITLTNVINTVNNISVPITLNHTNINHITVEEVPNIIKEETHAPIINTERCCTVILPRVCNETGCQVVTRSECSPRCTREVITIPDIYPIYPIYQPVIPQCGIATQCPILQPPLPQPQPQPQPVQCPPLCSPPCPQSSGCIQPYVQPYIPPQLPVQTCQYPYYPYSYCGTGQLNCLGCYFCNGRFNPQECASSRECPLPCLGGTGRLSY